MPHVDCSGKVIGIGLQKSNAMLRGAKPPEAKETKPKALLIGYKHDSLKDAEFVATALTTLKSQGIKNVALELPKDLQPGVDRYINSKHTDADRKAFAEFQIGKTLPELPQEDRELARFDPTRMGMFRILDSAAKEGLSVRCVDASAALIGKISRDADKLGNTSITADTASKLMRIPERNATIAKNISELGEPTAYVGGFLHLGHGASKTSLDDRLAIAGFNTLSISTPESAAFDELRCKPSGNELNGTDIISTNPNIIKSLNFSEKPKMGVMPRVSQAVPTIMGRVQTIFEPAMEAEGMEMC